MNIYIEKEMEPIIKFRKKWVKYVKIFNDHINIMSECKKINYNLDGILSNNELLSMPSCQILEYEKNFISNICNDYIELKIKIEEFSAKIDILNTRLFGKDFDNGLSIIYILLTRKEGNENLLEFANSKLEVLVKDFYEYIKTV